MTDDELDAAETTIEDHVVGLFKDYFEVEIPKEDIRACHRVGKKGDGIVVRFCDRSAGSSWGKLTKKGRVIKKGDGQKGANIFLNFQLTSHRSWVAAEIRQFFKDGAIAGHSVDCNGKFIIFKEGVEKPIPLQPCTFKNLEAIVGKKTQRSLNLGGGGKVGGEKEKHGKRKASSPAANGGKSTRLTDGLPPSSILKPSVLTMEN